MKGFFKRVQFPNTIVLLFFIMIFVTFLTWVIPSGEYAREIINGRTVVIPNSFNNLGKNPQGFFGLFTALPKAFEECQEIVLFILIVGGTFHIVNESNVLTFWINKVIQVFSGKKLIIIPVVLLILGLAGTTIGLKEETLMLVPIGISMALALGFDVLTGVAIVSLGAAFGFYTSVINPFSVGIAQEIAELPIFSGIWFRIALFITYWIITSLYIVRYANKVNSNPDLSLTKDQNVIFSKELRKENINGSKKIIISTIIIVLCFALILYGVFELDWFISEIGSVFLIMAFLVGILTYDSLNSISDSLISGMSELVEPAMVLVFARAILVIMERGMILDPIVNYLINVVSQLPGVATALGFYIIQIIVNFVIPASTGQAATTMPIMTPIADGLEINRQIAVLAYILGSGFMDSIIPTSGVLMAQLTIAKIPFKKWVKFMAPLMVIWLLLGAVFIVIAYYINYGPF